MEFDRTKNAKRILRWGIIKNLVLIFIPFVMRTIVIYTLGNIYTGLHSLFNSILEALNLSELGIGSALVFAMYKPVAEDDTDKVNAYLKIYRIAYLIIGSFVAVSGLILIPFLPMFITDTVPDEINIYIIYLIQLASTSFGYFFLAYKSSILEAYQRKDIIYKSTLVAELLTNILQIVALVVFKNYYIYIGIVLVRQVIYNLCIGFYVDKKYPKIKAKGNITKEETEVIFKKTGALFTSKASNLIITCIDNIFISAFIGLEVLTFFNNYLFIVKAIAGLFLIAQNGLHSVVGNYMLKSSKENLTKMFNMMHYILCLCICFACSCFTSMFQPFITLWVGEESLLPMVTVFLFVAYFFATRIRNVEIIFKDAAGIWEPMIPCSIIVIVLDLVIDITLFPFIGINGALISTIVAMIFSFIYESIIIYKKVLNTNPISYFFRTLLYLIVIGGSCCAVYFICRLFTIENNILTLLACLGVSTFISIVCFTLSTCWTKDFKLSLQFVKNKILKRS